MRRRRECSGCGRRFTTYEHREREPLFVRKRSGKRQPFDRTKLRAALLHAAHKRPVSSADVERLVERIESAVNDGGGELAAERIGELCLDGLRQLDTGAYLQFAGTLAEPGAGDFRRLDGGWFRPGRAQGSPVHPRGRHQEDLMSKTAAKYAQNRQAGLTVERRFTNPGVHPFDEVEWELRDAVIGDPESPAFEQRGVEFPKTLVAERDQHRRPEVLPRQARHAGP